jgi:uncharacterized protein YndB with AHSA1/START domain
LEEKMTEQKALKRRIRARMEKTGERYTAARRQVVGAEPDAPPQVPEGVPMPSSDEAIKGGTGKSWPEWLQTLDAWGGTSHNHTEIARWLVDEQRVDPWWAQNVAVGYERARGLRALHQRSDGGFSVSVNKTIAALPERLTAAVVDEEQRTRWLAAEGATLRNVRGTKVARLDWAGPKSIVAFTFDPKPNGRTSVNVTQEKLPDAETRERLRLFWKDTLEELKAYVER